MPIIGTPEDEPATVGAQIRPLLPEENGAYLAHLLRLDPLSRFMRFGGYVSETALRRQASRAMAEGVSVLGYFPDGELRGVAELHPLPAHGRRPRAAEIAFSVERPWQGKGVGSALMDALIALARTRGLADLRIAFLAGNGRMKKIALAHAAELATDANETTGRLTARPRTPFSWLRRALEGVFSVVGAGLALQESLLPAAHRGE